MARPGNFHKKIPKNSPQAEILEPQENTPKILKNYQKRSFWYFVGIFSVFSGIFGVNSGSPEFRAGGYFSWKFRVGPSRGSVGGSNVIGCGESRKLKATPDPKRNGSYTSTPYRPPLYGINQNRLQ